MRLRTDLCCAALILWVFSSSSPLHAQSVDEANVKGERFSYSGDLGPGFWNKIDAACATSPVSRQSPIDIDDVVVDDRLQPLQVLIPETTYKVVNKGYTVEAKPHETGVLVLHRVAYNFEQFHFHTLAEHTVQGRRGEMEMHLVFKNAQDELAVIGVVFKIGKPNALLERIIAAGIPQQTGDVIHVTERMNLGEALTDLSSYYSYSGSLTTPGCNEGVKWMVLKQWAEMSPEQFEAFRHVLGNDFRPLQKRNGRDILATAK